MLIPLRRFCHLLLFLRRFCHLLLLRQSFPIESKRKSQVSDHSRLSHILSAFRIVHDAFQFSQFAYRISHIAYRISHFAYRISHFAYRISHIANLYDCVFKFFPFHDEFLTGKASRPRRHPNYVIPVEDVVPATIARQSILLGKKINDSSNTLNKVD